MKPHPLGYSLIDEPSSWAVEDCGFDSPCWVWQRARRSRAGYGTCRLNGKLVLAHRAMYEKHNGPIPEGLHIDHLCRNPACVNPGHLEPVHRDENVRRGDCAKLDYELAEQMRQTPGTHAHVAQKFGVSVSTAHAVRSGQRWVAQS